MAGKFEESTIKKLEDAIKLGATYELACKYAGISYQTYRNWTLRGERETERAEKATKHKDYLPDEAPYVLFVERMNDAEGLAAMQWLAKIEKAASDTWQAAAWKLERRYPQTYGKQALELTGKDGGAVEVTFPKFVKAVPPDDSSGS